MRFGNCRARLFAGVLLIKCVSLPHCRRPRQGPGRGSITIRKLLSVLLFALAACAGAHSQTTAEIIAKHLAARGGLRKIRAVKTERVSGRISFGAGNEGPFVVESKRPLKMHMEIMLQGKSLVRGFDGTSGWQINPFGPQTGPQPMSAEDSANIAKEADFDGPLVDSRAKRVHIELTGKEPVNGNPAWKLKVTLADGAVDYYFVDAASYLITEWQGQRTARGQQVIYTSEFSDFRKVDGLTFPFSVVSRAPGSEVQQTIVTTKIELNVSMADSLFRMPPPSPTALAPPQPPRNR